MTDFGYRHRIQGFVERRSGGWLFQEISKGVLLPYEGWANAGMIDYKHVSAPILGLFGGAPYSIIDRNGKLMAKYIREKQEILTFTINEEHIIDENYTEVEEQTQEINGIKQKVKVPVQKTRKIKKTVPIEKTKTVTRYETVDDAGNPLADVDLNVKDFGSLLQSNALQILGNFGTPKIEIFLILIMFATMAIAGSTLYYSMQMNTQTQIQTSLLHNLTNMFNNFTKVFIGNQTYIP